MKRPTPNDQTHLKIPISAETRQRVLWAIISSELQTAGYSVHLLLPPEQRVRTLQELVQQRGDAFILLASVKRPSSELTDYLLKSDRPSKLRHPRPNSIMLPTVMPVKHTCTRGTPA